MKENTHFSPCAPKGDCVVCSYLYSVLVCFLLCIALSPYIFIRSNWLNHAYPKNNIK